MAETPEQRIADLIREKAILRDNRDILRESLVTAISYSAGYLVQLLCTTGPNKAVHDVAEQLAERLEHIARLVRPQGQYEDGCMEDFRDSIIEIRKMVAGETGDHDGGDGPG